MISPASFAERQPWAGGGGPRGADEAARPGAGEKGFGVLLKDAVDDSEQFVGEIADDTTACGTEGVLSPRTPGAVSPGRFDVVGIVAGAAQAAERPDFTGSWRCIRVEGEIHQFLIDMGMSPIKCEAARTARYGAGYQLQTISQDGDHFSVIDHLKTTNTMTCQIGLGPQTSCDLEGRKVTITPTWDGQTLCVETMTGSGKLFATSRRFYDGDEMVLEITSPNGTTTRRIFCKKDSTKPPRATCSTRLSISTVTS